MKQTHIALYYHEMQAKKGYYIGKKEAFNRIITYIYNTIQNIRK